MAVRTLGAHPLLFMSLANFTHLSQVREFISSTNDDVREDSRCTMRKPPRVYPGDIEFHVQSSRPTGLEFGDDPFWAIDFMIASTVHQLQWLFVLVDQLDFVKGDTQLLSCPKLALFNPPELMGLPVTRKFVRFKQFLSCHFVV